MSIETDLRAAVGHYSAGRLAQAETLCRRVVGRQPKHVDALNLLAVLCCRTGRIEDGLALTSRVLSVKPDNLQALEVQGDAQTALSRDAAAAATFDRA
ncbi:tetratricopeptide repeat protein, partial [Rhodoplanes sp. TEM]